MKPTLLIASGNPGKLREISEILTALEIELRNPRDIDLNLTVEETGTTYSENALLKARAYQQASGLPVLADDSGLEVQVLGGKPGIHSARYSPKENANDADRRAYLLSQIKEKPQPWHAHFHCTAILAMPNGQWYETIGRCAGVIIAEERGDGGFGYDPVFYLPEYQATMAQLSSKVKNRISHRAIALAAMVPIIQAQLIGD